MSDNLKKILVILGILLGIFAISFIIYKQIEISNRQKEIESSIIKQKDIGDNIIRSMSQYATAKDLEKTIKDSSFDLSKINKDLDVLNSKVDSINKILITSVGYDWHDLPSTGAIVNKDQKSIVEIPCGDKKITCLTDPNNYFGTTQFRDIQEIFGETRVPFGRASFSAARSNPWDILVLQREYKIATVSAIDENNRTTNYNKFQISVGGKEYALPITKAETTQVYPDAKMRWFSPRLYVGVDGGVTSHATPDFGPKIQMFFMNYGKYVQTPDFAILGVGLSAGALDKRGYVSVTPFSYNIGKHIPFIQNTHLGLSLNVGFDATLAVMGGINVGL